MYLTGDFTKEMLTDTQVQDVKDFMAKVARGIAMTDADFDIRRGVIEALNVAAKLSVEDGEKVVRVRCVVGDDVCTLHPAESALGDTIAFCGLLLSTLFALRAMAK